MTLRIGFVEIAAGMIGVLVFCLTSFPKDNGSAARDPGVDDYFLSKLNPAIGPAERPRSSVWEDAVYNQAVALYRKGQYAQAASLYEEVCNRFAKACTN